MSSDHFPSAAPPPQTPAPPASMALAEAQNNRRASPHESDASRYRSSTIAGRAGRGRRPMARGGLGSRTRPYAAGPALRVVTMGGFAVRSAGRLLLEGDFERRKARALLAALLCAGEPVHREQLLEWFWPALCPRRGLACLFTTLYVLRRTLEPALRSGLVSSHVLCEGESYRLHLGERGSWDGAEILRAAGRAADADAGGLALRDLETRRGALRGLVPSRVDLRGVGPAPPGRARGGRARPSRAAGRGLHRRRTAGAGDPALPAAARRGS
jgi:hypothetical protein